MEEYRKAENIATGDLPEEVIREIGVFRRAQLAQEVGLPPSTPWDTLVVEQYRQQIVSIMGLPPNTPLASIGQKMLAAGMINQMAMPEPGETWASLLGDAVRRMQAIELGLPEDTPWETIQVAELLSQIRQQMGLTADAALNHLRIGFIKK